MRKEKIRENDFKESERPSTRLAQFFDIFKHRFLEIFKLSFLQAIFAMPLAVSMILFYWLLKYSTNINAMFTVFLTIGASALISCPSLFVGLTGVFYCIKKIAYAEGEYASSSFFIGLREEWKKGILIGVLQGFSLFIAVLGFFFAYFYLPEISTALSGFAITILIVQLIVVTILCYYSVAQVVIYNNKLRFILKNSFIFTLIRFPFNLFFFIIHPGIILALFSIMEITMYVGVGLLLFLSSFGHLIWCLNTISAFDKYINKENYPDFYRKGLNKLVIKED